MLNDNSWWLSEIVTILKVLSAILKIVDPKVINKTVFKVSRSLWWKPHVSISVLVLEKSGQLSKNQICPFLTKFKGNRIWTLPACSRGCDNKLIVLLYIYTIPHQKVHKRIVWYKGYNSMVLCCYTLIRYLIKKYTKGSSGIIKGYNSMVLCLACTKK